MEEIITYLRNSVKRLNKIDKKYTEIYIDNLAKAIEEHYSEQCLFKFNKDKYVVFIEFMTNDDILWLNTGITIDKTSGTELYDNTKQIKSTKDIYKCITKLVEKVEDKIQMEPKIIKEVFDV